MALSWHDRDAVLKPLAKKPMSVKDIATMLGIGKASAWRRIQRLKSSGLVRIAGWWVAPEGSKGKFIALFGPANGEPDAPRPPWRKPTRDPEYELARTQRRALQRAEQRLVRKLAEAGPYGQLVKGRRAFHST